MGHRGVNIEKGAVGIEDTSLDPGKGWKGHDDLANFADAKPSGKRLGPEKARPKVINNSRAVGD
jgi:hypothetical protein